MGMGRFLDAFEDVAGGRHTDVDPLDASPTPGRSVNGAVLEGAHAVGFPMHGHFRDLAGMGNGVRKLGSKGTREQGNKKVMNKKTRNKAQR